MADLRKRRIGRRTLLIGAGVILLVSGYLGSYMTLHALYGARIVTPPLFFRLRETVYAPANYYVDSYFPGAKTVRRAARWCLLAADKGEPPEWSRTDDPGWYW